MPHQSDARFLPGIWDRYSPGAGKFKADLPRVLADQSNDLTSAMRRILASTFDELRQLELRIAEVNREIEAIASQSDTARRLMYPCGGGRLV